jgi:hypothetical protein
MATPQSITVVHAGLSGAFDKTFPRIPSSGTCNHQGMPYRPRMGSGEIPHSQGGAGGVSDPRGKQVYILTLRLHIAPLPSQG